MGGYTIEREIGSGGMSAVYLAHRQDRRVAIKVLTEANALARFQREAIQQFKHPHIIRVYRWGQERGYHYIVMDYAPYGSLNSHLEEAVKQGQHLGLVLSLDIALQIARGLEYAHQHKVIHRDIKPNNILLDQHNGVVRAIIIDFGVARIEDGQTLTKHGALVGTPEYMSPEQARGNQVDTRSDIYSLGLVLYYMLSGRPPVKADTPFAALHQQVYETPSPIPHIPTSVQKVIFKAIEKKPAKRYQSMSQFIQNLETVKTKITRSKSGSTPILQKSPLPSQLSIYWIGGILAAIVLFIMMLSFVGGSSSSATATPISSTDNAGSVIVIANTSTPTKQPTATPRPRPTTRIPPSPLPTHRPTPIPTPEPAAAPKLLYPEDDTAWTNVDTPETLQWSWERPLADDEIFVVIVYYQGSGGRYPAQDCVLETNFPIKKFKWLIDPANAMATTTQFEWTVQVKRKISDDCEEVAKDGIVISQAEELRRFEWVP